MIYFVQSISEDGPGPIKIGTSRQLSVRLKQLADDDRSNLQLLAVVPGSYVEEAALHIRFDFCRLNGEWFKPDPILLAFIVDEGQPWDGEDEVPNATLAIKCRQEYKEWLMAFAKKKRVPPSQLVDMALVAWAKAEGEEIPPDRM